VLQSGLVSITFRKLAPAEVVALVRQAGLRGIEWGGDIHVPHGDLGRAREVRELTMEAGLTIPAYGSYYRAGQSETAGLPFGKVLESALELGTPLIRVWAGAAGSETTDDDARWHIVSDLKRIAEQAGKAGVRIAAEFHGGTLNDTNASASQLLLEVDHPNFYSYWQPLADMSDAVCVEGLTALSPRLAHVHVFQWRTPQDRQPLAEGVGRWTEFLRQAAAAPGDRYAMLEFVQDDAPENFLRDAATLKTWLAALA
jgi:3-dehydroshikimate dehydratase